MAKALEQVPPTKHGQFGEQGTITGYGTTRSALHACERCGYVRRVQLTPRMRNGVEVGGSVTARCRACDLELNAIKYERLASINRKRAAEARTAQALRRLKPYRSK